MAPFSALLLIPAISQRLSSCARVVERRSQPISGFWDLSTVSRFKTNAVVSIERVSNSTVPPSASAILSGGARSLSLKFKHVVKPSSTRSMAERKGQVYADKWAALLQLRWVLEASEHYPGNHGIYGSADRNLERIRQLFGNLLSFAWKWSVDLVASLYFFYSGRYLL